MLDDERKYIHFEPNLREIMKRYVTLKSIQEEKTMDTVKEFVAALIMRLKQLNPVLKKLNLESFFNGSCYDGLKIGKPNECDINLFINIPRGAFAAVVTSNVPGYVNVHMKNLEGIMHNATYKVFKGFVDDRNYLLTCQFLNYFKNEIKKVLNFLKYQICIKGKYYKLRETKQGGPVFTLELEGERGKFCVSIDLAPCLLMHGPHYPTGGFKRSPYSEEDFFIVPKHIKKNQCRYRYWRLSMAIHEKKMMNNLNQLKSTIKLMKHIRDVKKHNKISSYCIKNMFLCDLEAKTFNKNYLTWSAPLSHCLMRMLNIYADYLRDGWLPYFWNKKLNMIEEIDDQTLQDYENDIRAIIEDIEESDDPDAIWDILN